MKHKGERHIPDFSRKPKPSRTPDATRDAAPVARPIKTALPKPHGTSSKSGRRGT